MKNILANVSTFKIFYRCIEREKISPKNVISSYRYYIYLCTRQVKENFETYKAVLFQEYISENKINFCHSLPNLKFIINQ